MVWSELLSAGVTICDRCLAPQAHTAYDDDVHARTHTCNELKCVRLTAERDYPV